MATAKISPSLSPLEALPLEILETICEFLAHFHSNRRALFAFSLASRTCSSAATKQRFERIRFQVRGKDKLHRDVERWDETLGLGRHAYVRRVRIDGHIPLREMNLSDDEEHYQKSYANERFRHLSEDYDESDLDDDWDHFCKPSKDLKTSFNRPLPTFSKEIRQLQDEMWLPLARFLGRLPALRDLVYSSPDPLSACILSSMRRHHPNSRLHVHELSLPNLFLLAGLSGNTKPDEFSLTALPCLHSVDAMYHDFYHNSESIDYHEQMLSQIAAAAASRLQSVQLFYHSARWWPAREQGHPGTLKALGDGPLTGKQGDSTTLSNSRARLQSLVLGGNSRTLNRHHFDAWDAYIDLSRLQSLEIRKVVDSEVLQSLNHLAKDLKLESLHSLALSGTPYIKQGWSVHETFSDMDGTMSQLLHNLNSLDDLRLKGFVGEKTFKAVLDRHGPTLHRLQFVPDRQMRMRVEQYTISQSFVEEIQKNCPNLRELEMLVARTGGDELESGMYRLLGTLPKLKRLSLKLDCNSLSKLLRDRKHQPEESDLSRTRMREVLQGYAVDSSLARQIFHLVSKAGTVQHLRLEFAHDQYYFREWLSRMISFVSRSWVIRRTSAGKVAHRQVNKTRSPKMGCNRDSQPHLQQQLALETWPDMKTGDWKNEWYSLPLLMQPFED